MKTEKIAELNDAARKGVGVRVVLTPGIDELSAADKAIIRDRVANFTAFDEPIHDGNNPDGERNFGAFDHKKQTIFWKIDCFDKPDGKTDRVLTIMLSSEGP